MIHKMKASSVPSNRLWFMLAILILVLLLTACGGPAGSSPAPMPTKVIEIISTEPQTTDVPTQAATEMAAAAIPVNAENICSLVTKEEVEVVLGQPVSSITPTSDPDSISGSTLYSCTYLGNGIAMIISSLDVGSAEAGAKMFQTGLANLKATNTSITVTEETGIGEGLYWGQGERAVSYNVLKGSRVLGVAIGGNIGDPASYKAALRKLTEKVAASQ